MWRLPHVEEAIASSCARIKVKINDANLHVGCFTTSCAWVGLPLPHSKMMEMQVNIVSCSLHTKEWLCFPIENCKKTFQYLVRWSICGKQDMDTSCYCHSKARNCNLSRDLELFWRKFISTTFIKKHSLATYLHGGAFYMCKLHGGSPWPILQTSIIQMHVICEIAVPFRRLCLARATMARAQPSYWPLGSFLEKQKSC